MELGPRPNLIYVGQKPIDTYIHAVLVAARLGFDHVQVQGLGRMCGKALAIARAVQELNKAHITDIESFETGGGIQGVRVFLEFAPAYRLDQDKMKEADSTREEGEEPAREPPRSSLGRFLM